MLWVDLQEPVLHYANAAQVFADMLFSHIADGDSIAVAIHNGNAEQFLRQKDALGMMTQRSVAEIGKERLRLVKPWNYTSYVVVV